MKKSLFALAATTAFAGAAQAQSSVTVYGIMDMGYLGSSYNQNGVTSGGSGITSNNIKTTKNAFAAGAQQTNRLGFKGTEDLGAGRSAFFTVEFGLSPMDPNATGSSSAGLDLNGVQNQAGSAVDNRQSFVGLKQSGVGQFAFGRQYTPIFNYASATSPGAFNNVAGDAIYVAGSTGAQGAGFSNNIGFTNRMSNQLSLETDRFAGVRATGFYSMNNANSTVGANQNAAVVASATTGGTANFNGWGIGADYTWNKLLVNAAYQNVSTLFANPVVLSAVLIDLNGASTTGGQSTSAGSYAASNLKDNQQFAGATYDFGILKAYVQYVNRKIVGTGTSASNNTVLARQAEQIGVRSYITPTIEAWASGGMGRYQGAYGTYAANGTNYLNAASPWVNFTAYQVGSNYYLSKRTNVYAIYGRTQANSNSGNVAGSGNVASQYALGVRHTF